MAYDIKKARAHLDSAWNEQQRWYHRWNRAFELIVPERSERYRLNTGTSVAPYIYDTTAPEKAENLANQMISVLTPAGIPWLRLTPGPKIIGEDRLKMGQMLQGINQVISYYVQNANFSVAAQPAFLDMMVTAGALKIEPDPNGLGFTIECVPIHELAYRVNIHGQVSSVYRRYKVRAGQILEFEQYAEKLSEQTRRNYDQNPEQEIELCCAIEPIPGGEFHYCEWISNEQAVLEDKGIKRNPFLIFRWSAVSSTPYGRGPGLVKYHTILNVNTLSEYQLKAAGFDMLGIWGKKDDSVININTIGLYPGIQIVMESVSAADPSMRRIDDQGGSRYRIGQDTLDKQREEIVKAFYADKFSPIIGDKMSATEIRERSQDLAQALGAVWGRLEAELLRPFALMVLSILKEQGAFKGIKGVDANVLELLNIDRKELDVRFLGTLSQAQYMQNAQGALQYLSSVQAAAQMDPQLLSLVDTEGFFMELAEWMTVPPHLINNKEKRQEIMQEALKQQQMMQAQQAPQLLPGAPPTPI